METKQTTHALYCSWRDTREKKNLCSVWQKQYDCFFEFVLIYIVFGISWCSCTFQATDCRYNICSVRHWNHWALRGKSDGWMEGAVEGVCKTWFKNQKRGLRLDFWGGGSLSASSKFLWSSQIQISYFNPAPQTHIQAQPHQIAFISTTCIWLFDLSEQHGHAQMGCVSWDAKRRDLVK